MNVFLKALSFNHEPNSASSDAFSIRKNEADLVSSPEWTPGMTKAEQSLAAYARYALNSDVIIRAQFFCDDASIPEIYVQALDGNNGSTTNVLGSVPVSRIPLTQGQSDSVPITLHGVRMSSVEVSNVIWQWQFSLNPSDPKSWSAITTTKGQSTTVHRIYIVLDLPKSPWEAFSSEPTNLQIPWASVLDKACEWAVGAQHVDTAASMVTKNVNALGENGRVTYDYDSKYVLKGTDNFLCTEFLDRVAGGAGRGDTVNCTDCATAVSLFSNILGASLSQSAMGTNFGFNDLLKIGERSQGGGSFQRHEVAWKGCCTTDDPVFDACVQLDSGDPEENSEFVPFVPTNIRFGTPEDRQYEFRLSGRKNYGGLCQADPPSKKQRIVGTQQLRRRLISPNELVALRDFYNFAAWENTRLTDERIFIWHWRVSGTEFADWRTESIKVFDTEEDMPPTSESLWVPAEGTKERLRVTTFECDSLQSAHLFLLTVVGESDAPYMKREDPRSRTAFGDTAFTNLDATSLLFARGNVVVSATGIAPAKPDEFLHLFDTVLTTEPSGEGLIEMYRFRLPERKFFVDDEVPLEFTGDIEDAASYRFFSDSGDVFQRHKHLFYRPEVAGPQQIRVFAIDPSGETRQQKLNLLVNEKNHSLIAQQEKTDSVLETGENQMPHKLEGRWRSSVITFPTAPVPAVPVCTNDDEFYLNSIDPVTGIIVDGFHKFGTETRTIQGVVVPNGSNFSIVMEHDELRDPHKLRRYQGTVAFDHPTSDRVVIFARTFLRPKPSGGAAGPGIVIDASNAQDDGTVIITRP